MVKYEKESKEIIDCIAVVLLICVITYFKPILLSIYVYDGDLLVGNNFVATSGNIAVNEKSYSMKNAEQFIEQIIKIVE